MAKTTKGKVGEGIAAILYLLFAMYELIQAVRFGRMEDFFTEGDYLYFHDDTFLFVLQFIVLAGVLCLVLRWCWSRRPRT